MDYKESNKLATCASRYVGGIVSGTRKRRLLPSQLSGSHEHRRLHRGDQRILYKLKHTLTHATHTPQTPAKQQRGSQEPFFSSSFRIRKTIRDSLLPRWQVLAAHLLGQAGHAGGRSHRNLAHLAPLRGWQQATGGGCHLEFVDCCWSRNNHLKKGSLETPQVGNSA